MGSPVTTVHAAQDTKISKKEKPGNISVYYLKQHKQKLKEKAEQANQSANTSIRRDHSKSIERIDTSTHIGRK